MWVCDVRKLHWPLMPDVHVCYAFLGIFLSQAGELNSLEQKPSNLAGMEHHMSRIFQIYGDKGDIVCNMKYNFTVITETGNNKTM